MHLKGHLNINLVLLVVIPLLDGENFLVRKEDVFMPVLGVSTGGDALLLSIGSPAKQESGGVLLSRGALSCVERP